MVIMVLASIHYSRTPGYSHLLPRSLSGKPYKMEMVDKKAQDRLDVSGLEAPRKILNIFGRFLYVCSDIL